MCAKYHVIRMNCVESRVKFTQKIWSLKIYDFCMISVQIIKLCSVILKKCGSHCNISMFYSQRFNRYFLVLLHDNFVPGTMCVHIYVL